MTQEGAAHSPANQVVTALAELSRDICDADDTAAPVADTGSIRAGLRRLAMAARESGMAAYCSIVLRTAERLEPSLRAGSLAPTEAQFLRHWLGVSQGHLCESVVFRHAAALVDLLADGQPESAGAQERSELLLGLIEDRARLEGMRCSPRHGSGGESGRHADEQRRTLASKLPVLRRVPAAADRLAGSPDGRFIEPQLQAMLSDAREAGLRVAILSVGICGIDDIVGCFGRAIGEAALARVASALQRVVTGGGVTARTGEDRFVVLVPCVSAVRISREASRLVKCLAGCYEIGGHLVSLRVRVGIAIFPDDGNSAAELLRNAAVALRDAKGDSARAIRFFGLHMRRAALRRVNVEAELRDALEHGTFRLHFQPKISVESGRVTGVEALIRGPNRARHLSSPGEFIPIAEETGLVLPLGEWVTHSVCRQIIEWRRDAKPIAAVSVNLSPVQLAARRTRERILRALERYDVPPGLLELEITETAVTRNPEESLDCLNALARLGVRLTLDDFGVGYSNLGQLARMPFTTVKMDKSLIARIDTSRRDVVIVSSIIDICHRLGARVVAEGVETAQQRDALREAGCDEYQGYLFAEPMDAESLEIWLTRRAADAAVYGPADIRAVARGH